MAAITTAGSGNWSSTTPNAPWPSGTVPTSADTVTIANTHTVTLDTTAAVSTLTINAGGTLATSAAANTSITAQTTITNNGTWTCDLSSTAVYTSIISGNNSAAASDNCITHGAAAAITWKGYPRTRKTRLNGAITAGATSAVVDDATGWQVGDVICFASTQSYNATPRTDLVTLTSVSGNTVGWTGGITYDHADDGYVGNFSSNVIVGPPAGSETRRHSVFWSHGYSVVTMATKIIDNVQFYAGLGNSYNKYGQLNFGDGSGSQKYSSGYKWTISNNSFYDFCGASVFAQLVYQEILIDGCVFYSYRSNNVPGGTASFSPAIVANNTTNYAIRVNNCGIFRCTGHANSNAGILFWGNTGQSIKDTFVSACHYGLFLSGANFETSGLEIDSCNSAIYYDASNSESDRNKIGLVGSNTYAEDFRPYSVINVTCTNQQSQTLSLNGFASSLDRSKYELINKNNDVTQQEIYRPFCEIKRDNSEIYRSTSSISIKPTRISTDSQREKEILCANGSSIRVIGYVKKSDASNVAATVTLTGLGITPASFTKADDTNWEQYDLTATNSSGADGNLTLTYTANSSSGTANVVYFDGVPDAPFVTKCRHYGFTFDESNPVRTVNPYSVAAEATAISYTGVTNNNATKEISFAAGTADTAQKFYDYVQALMCANLSYEVPLVRAGSLYSLTTGWTVVDPYYSGDLTWGGGTVQYSTFGTKADDLDSCIVEFADTGGGTYTLSGTLSGTLDLRNLDADPITVEVATGTTTTDANNTGGTITVSTPQVTQSVVLSGGTAGSRVQIYDVTSSTELYNDIPASWPHTWTDSSPYAADREIRLRVMYVNGDESKLFIDQTIGTCTNAVPTLTYLVYQTDDAVYNANGIDGSALTGYQITGTTLAIEVSDGSATWPEMYAYEVYWLSTEDGIRDQDLYIEAIDTANYTFFGGFKIKNTSSPSVPLLVTGGNGEPSTGPATDLLDTSGGTIFCNSAIVVPYSSGAEVTEQIVVDGLTTQGYTTTRAGKIDTIASDVWSYTLP